MGSPIGTNAPSHGLLSGLVRDVKSLFKHDSQSSSQPNLGTDKLKLSPDAVDHHKKVGTLGGANNTCGAQSLHDDGDVYVVTCDSSGTVTGEQKAD